MKIDLKGMQFQSNAAFKGGEGVFDVKTAGDGDCKIMYGRLRNGSSIGLHRHVGNCEVIYVVAGEGEMFCEGERETLRVGDCHYCPDGTEHTLRNDRDEDLEFFAVVPTLKK